MAAANLLAAVDTGGPQGQGNVRLTAVKVCDFGAALPHTHTVAPGVAQDESKKIRFTRESAAPALPSCSPLPSLSL